MNPSFGPAALKSLEPTVDRYVNKMIVGVEQKALQNGDIIEINEWFHNLAFDVHPLPLIVVDCRLPVC
jgi:cytochrome P450